MFSFLSFRVIHPEVGSAFLLTVLTFLEPLAVAPEVYLSLTALHIFLLVPLPRLIVLTVPLPLTDWSCC